MKLRADFDRTQFFAGTHDGLRKHQLQQMQAETMQERMRGFWEHTCRVYGIDPKHAPPFDKTAFSMRKHERP
jgi:hypothetical protein